MNEKREKPKENSVSESEVRIKDAEEIIRFIKELGHRNEDLYSFLRDNLPRDIARLMLRKILTNQTDTYDFIVSLLENELGKEPVQQIIDRHRQVDPKWK